MEKAVQRLRDSPEQPYLDKKCFMAVKSPSAKVLWSKIILAVSSIEFCQEIFDERDIREALSGGSGHVAMIPLRQIISFSLFVLNCNTSGKA
jgi:hypothetical protein